MNKIAHDAGAQYTRPPRDRSRGDGRPLLARKATPAGPTGCGSPDTGHVGSKTPSAGPGRMVSTVPRPQSNAHPELISLDHSASHTLISAWAAPLPAATKPRRVGHPCQRTKRDPDVHGPTTFVIDLSLDKRLS